MKFKPYEEYKKVDLPWLDEIPSHWEIDRGKNLFKQEKRKVKAEDEVITCFRDGEVTLRKNRRTTGFTESIQEIGYQGIKKGDLVIHQMDSFAGAAGVSDSDGKGSPILSICNGKILLNNYYYAFIVREMAHNGFIMSLSRGIRERSTDFRFKTFAEQLYPFPPKEEQDKIVDFLDYNLGKIDKFVELTERQIELLKEQKEILINDAVTKGIDKDVAYKDSGIDWIGEIPEHWEVIRLKRILISNESGNWGEEPLNNTDDIYVLRSTEQNYDGGWRIDWSEVAVRNIANICGKNILKKEDLLLTKSSGSFNHIGKVSIVTENIEKKNVTFSNFMQKLRVDKNNYPYYYWIILNSNVVKQQYRILSTTTTGLSNLNVENIKNILVTLPPILEQRQIVAYIEKETNKIDRTIELYKNQIDLIKEYRTSLIASAVTGKIDVRDF